jgi:hypothetical protein
VTRGEIKMSLFFRIATLEDLVEIQEFETKKLHETVSDSMEREIQSWNSKWRKEALEHYLPSGWSFMARDPAVQSSHSDEGQLVGYFLAQPMLFFDGQTQSLWVEHVAYSSLQSRDEICDLAYRLSKEKHFQRVYFPNSSLVQNSISHLKPHGFTQAAVYINTTKV